jgi:sugar lactone lactonase YvrE
MGIRFGSGSLQFELVEGWERPPEGLSHGDVAGVCCDSDDNVYLFCRKEHPVIIYDRDGKFQASWGEGQFGRTHGMSMSGGNEVFLVDVAKNFVGRYSLDGTLRQSVGPVGTRSDTGCRDGDFTTVAHGAPPYNAPTNVAIAASGDIYVSDGYGNARVHRFGNDGSLVQSWGEPGGGPGEFRIPHGVCVHADGRVFVADRENDRIQIFGPDGTYLTEWDQVQRPCDIFIDGANLVYVAELSWYKGEHSLRHGPVSRDEPARLSIYDIDGHLLVRWADPDPTKPGYFVAPHGVWVDSEGSIYLAEVPHTWAVKRGYAPPDVHTLQKFARM